MIGGTEGVVDRLSGWLACNGGDVAGNDVDDDRRRMYRHSMSSADYN